MGVDREFVHFSDFCNFSLSELSTTRYVLFMKKYLQNYQRTIFVKHNFIDISDLIV